MHAQFTAAVQLQLQDARLAEELRKRDAQISLLKRDATGLQRDLNLYQATVLTLKSKNTQQPKTNTAKLNHRISMQNALIKAKNETIEQLKEKLEQAQKRNQELSRA